MKKAQLIIATRLNHTTGELQQLVLIASDVTAKELDADFLRSLGSTYATDWGQLIEGMGYDTACKGIMALAQNFEAMMSDKERQGKNCLSITFDYYGQDKPCAIYPVRIGRNEGIQLLTKSDRKEHIKNIKMVDKALAELA